MLKLKRVSTWALVLCSLWSLPAWGQQVEGMSEVVSLDIQPADAEAGQPSGADQALVNLGGFFQTPSEGMELDAGGEGELQITVSNQGTKPARDITVTVQSSSVDELEIGEDRRVVGAEPRPIAQIDTSLGPSEYRQINVPIYAPESLPEGEIELGLRVEMEEGEMVGGTERLTIPTGDVTTDPIVDRRIPETRMDRSGAVAVVIGVSQYTNADVPSVDYAVRDAETVGQYLKRTLGFEPGNILSLENPTQSELNAVLGTAENHEGRLHDYLPSDTSEVFVYYSGHGAPNAQEDGRSYFLPSDGSPKQLGLTGYPVDQLYENLSKVTSGPVTVAIDACFSGQTEAGTLVQEASPALLSVENPAMSLDKGLVFTASEADEISSWYSEKKHGLFTYFFLQGLRENADRDENGRITGEEMGTYLAENVETEARRLHSRPQNPQTLGKAKDRVLVQYEEQ